MDSQQSRVLVQLRDMILKGEFGPGERLAEIPLSERLGASRIVIVGGAEAPGEHHHCEADPHTPGPDEGRL